MNWKRVGRLLVCLVLVCCILVNVSPIKAKAVEPVTMMVAAASVIAAVIIGLGVMVGSDPLVFDQVVEKVAKDETVSKIISVDFELPVIKYNATTGGIDDPRFGFAVALTLIEAIRQALYKEEVLTETVSYDSFALSDGTVIPAPTDLNVSTYPNIFVFSCNDDKSLGLYYRIMASKSGYPFSHKYEGGYDCVYYGATYIKVFKGRFLNGSWDSISEASNQNVKVALQLNSYYDLVWSSRDILSSDGSVFYPASALISSVNTLEDLSLGEIAPQTQNIMDGYPSWSAGAVIDETEDYWFPIGMGQTYDETKNYVQEQVQAGEGTYQGEESGDVTDPDSDQVTASGLKGWIDSFKTSVDMWFARVSLNVSNILDAVSSLPQAITAPIIDALDYIFVPREDFVSDKVSELRNEFAFADTLITGGQMIGDAFNGFDTSPPIIYIDLGATRGDYDIGGKVPFIDLTWYEEYKPTVDMLLSSFLWVVFIWKLFQKAPGIISGMPGDFVMEGLQSLNMDVYLPMRSQSHEKVRRLNRRSKL